MTVVHPHRLATGHQVRLDAQRAIRPRENMSCSCDLLLRGTDRLVATAVRFHIR